ncbi:hypothetical protein GIB67_029343 [Kingdonia uniflora]|uniref:HMG box domain-containing protein n=1 Tax=Kingdonia uniflora TaxID=39325 RepID=A0A7J7MEU5_9MAGN|nr:hypothetical protein GIB67_003567 [Kingdonia uniflora]KAF6163500.1 hypothetical protein GIB67_029343 [Kingdonia uniflora]
MAPSKTNPPRTRKRVDVVETTTSVSLKRARDGSAFTKCDECQKDVPVVLIDMHNCSLDSKIKMNLEAQVIERVSEAKKPVQRDDFRKTFKETHPANKSVSVVAKEGGEAWRAMGEEEKQAYLDRVAKLKEEYIAAMEKYKADNEDDEVEVIEDQAAPESDKDEE